MAALDPHRNHTTYARRALILALTALLTACASAPAQRAAWPTPADVAVQKSGFTAEGLAALDARMKQAVENKEVAGVVTLLVRQGEVAAYNVHGVRSFETGAPMTADTLFRIYSMTKPITGVALMQLHEQGLWKPDDPITKFIPEFENLEVLKQVEGRPVTVNVNRPATMRELMTHTAGFGYGLAMGNPVDDAFRAAQPLGKPDMKSMIDAIASLPLLAQPGERWSYSIAVDIQGAIVERLSGRKFGEYLAEHIFEPLGMTDTKFFLDESERARLAEVYQWSRESGGLKPLPDAPGRSFFDASHVESGGGGLVSTMHDYARFCQMLLNKGELDGKRILKRESVELMTQNHIGALRLFSDGTRPNSGLPGTGFGLDFAVVTDPAAAKTGQGVGTYYWSGIAGTWFWIDPVNDLFFIGMIQRRGGAGPNAVDFRADSTRLVYQGLSPKGTVPEK